MASASLHYVGTVVDGQLKISNRRGFDEDMRAFDGYRLLISVKRYHKQRSLKQNAYYHGCIIPYVQGGLLDMGFEKHILGAETVHDMLKNKFLKEDVPVESGEFITLVKSTSDLSTVEFMDYIDEIKKWAAEFLNINIPDPGEQGQFDY